MEKKDSSSKYIIKHPVKKGFVSEFFNHMITYGGFSFENGNMNVWGDPSLFTPIIGFSIYINELKKKLGNTTNDILYWIGSLYGRNSTYLLIKKFGFNKKKIPDFVNGATQDGFGFIELQTLKDDGKNIKIILHGTNSALALKYKKLYGKQKNPIDYYMCGILAGGSEPLFNRDMKCVETKCMAKEEKLCIYTLNNIPKRQTPDFFKKLKIDEKLIRKKTETTSQKRKINFKFFQKKNIKFGDGNFILNGYVGLNIASYEHVLLDKFTHLLLGEKKFKKIKNKVAKSYIDETFNKNLISNKLTSKNIKNVLEKIKLFGFGNLTIHIFKKNTLILKNENNPYLEDQKIIFNKIDYLGMHMLNKIIRYAFKKYFNKEVSITPMKTSSKISFIKLRFLS